jgi:hypothetical protein
MLEATTPQALARYHLERDTELPRVAQRLSWVYGLPNISITVDSRERNSCRLTTDGIVLTINADSILQISLCNDFGVKGSLPLALADTLTVAHQMERARDFCDSGFHLERSPENRRHARARRFFNSTIDDVAIAARMRRVPLFDRYLDEFASRLVRHDTLDLPPHIQFMNALRIVCTESDPRLSTSPEISALLRELTGQGVLEALTASDLGFDARRDLADRAVYPLFLQLLERDLIRYDSHLLRDLYERSTPFGEADDDDPQLLGLPVDGEPREDIERFYTTTKDTLMDLSAAATQDLGEASEQEDDGSPGLMLPRLGESGEELCLDEEGDPGYLATVSRWRAVISDVADTLLRLALPKERIAVPRYRARASAEGIRLHPSALPLALVQLETESPQAIWQPIRQLMRHQELEFGGLDIYLLLDVSGSMGGPNAQFASATSLCLIEGLQTARLRARREQTQGAVDVRVQLLAFGAGWAQLTPLVNEPTLAQKERAFHNLLHPQSNFTKVNGALRHVRSNALANPSRKVLCLIVSDGLFSDNLAAFRTMQNMPRQVYAGHINIGDFRGIPITPHFETITEPRVLPQKLQNLLEEYLRLAAVSQ